MRAAVLGAGGTIAPAIVRDLAESSEIEGLLLLDLDRGRAQATADAHGCGRARVGRVEPGGDLAAAIDGCDVLVNAASYRANLEAMEACLAAGCHYIDLGGLYWMTGRQLELHERFCRAGLLALLGMGSSPGKTNVMARAAVDELGLPPQRIEVVAAGRDLDPPEGFSPPYAVRTLVDELTLRPVVLREGEPVEIEPLADGGPEELPEPIGRAQTIHTLHSELRTFGESFGCREASFRLSLAPGLLERLRALAAASDDEIDRAARSAAAPSSNTLSVHRVRADGVTVTAVTRPHGRWGIGGGVVSTAAPAAAAVRLLARGRIAGRGALPPERCVSPGDLFPELEARGCEFLTETMEESRA